MAVIGCGYWGPNLVRNLIALPSREKVTCCDLDSNKLGKIYYISTSMEMECFMKALKTGKTDKSTGLDGLKVVKVLEAAEKSLRNEGKQISIG